MQRRKFIQSIIASPAAVPLAAGQAATARPRPRPGGPGNIGRIPPLPPIEFLGWDYARLGYSLSSGEEMALRYRNNLSSSSEVPVAWTLTTYAGVPLAQGKRSLSLRPGETGQIPISLPAGLEDGAYFVYYDVGGSTGAFKDRFHFDFRRPAADEKLNLTVVSLIENMDGKGWTRSMFGPLASYVRVLCSWPNELEDVDAALVIAENLKPGDSRLEQLMRYARRGGKVVIFGKPAAALSELLPIRLAGEPPWLEAPLRLQLSPGGPWSGFDPDEGPRHYGLRVEAKTDAAVLAEWDGGPPAVVSRSFGEGNVVFVGAGAGQVWQRRDSLDGADEMWLRLVYWLTGGDEAVSAVLSRAGQLHADELRSSAEVRNRVLAGMPVSVPQKYVALGRNNAGRFGWLISEGGLAESLEADGVVSTIATRPFAFRGGAPWASDHRLSFSLGLDGGTKPKATSVTQNWFGKTVTWRYENSSEVNATLSMGSPAILWEGKASHVALTGSAITHVAYQTPSGVRIAQRDESIDPADLSESWLIAFTAHPDVRDMPQLIVLTRRPDSIRFASGIQLRFGAQGFGSFFTSRLWGIRRLAPGETGEWTNGVPAKAVAAARQWSRAFLRYPFACDEVAWVEEEALMLASRFRFRAFTSDWGAEALAFAPLPPVLLLAKSAGAPVQLPPETTDLAFDTKYGPLHGVSGETTLVRVPLPPRDHRALIPAAGRMELQELIDESTAGLRLGKKKHPDANIRNEGSGNLYVDLAPYDIYNSVPFPEMPCIDLYKWWLTFSAILARPVYSSAVREKIDQHYRNQYWETLNFYSHKCMVMQKREPFSGVEYIIHFVWPTQSQYGYRNFNDGNEASGLTATCFASYARYYGDWTTLGANWNHCRRLYEFLPRVHDWACMSSGALESWGVAGLDMLNSEPYGSLDFAYAAARVGYPQDEIVGLVLGAKSMVAAVARLGFQDYLHSVTADGDPWREFEGFYWFHENGIQASVPKMGGVAMLDTSKGTSHEFMLAYKTWAGDRMRREEEALEREAARSERRRISLPNLTQRLFLGWDIKGLREQARRAAESGRQRGTHWSSATSLYDLALLCIGDIPLFLSDWAPAEYVSGKYAPVQGELNLVFRSQEHAPYRVRIYSQREPLHVTVNGAAVAQSEGGWRYEPASGWFDIRLDGAGLERLHLVLGDSVAPLHPYFTGVKVASRTVDQQCTKPV